MTKMGLRKYQTWVVSVRERQRIDSSEKISGCYMRGREKSQHGIIHYLPYLLKVVAYQQISMARTFCMTFDLAIPLSRICIKENVKVIWIKI